MEKFVEDNADTRLLIKMELEKQKRSINWLAKGMDVTRGHLILVLKQERKLTLENLSKANELLNTSFAYREAKTPQ